jgi:hypothetical protein
MDPNFPPAGEPPSEDMAAYLRFRRALRKADQQALDELFERAKPHTLLAQYAPQALPIEVALLSMLLEEHKILQTLQQKLDALRQAQPPARPEPGHPPLSNPSPSNPPNPARVDPGFGFDDSPARERG